MLVLLLSGTKDPIVGNADEAKEVARAFPDIQVEILQSGYLIAVERTGYINHRVHDFQVASEEKSGVPNHSSDKSLN